MSWFERIAGMSVPEAMAVLGFNGQNPSLEEIQDQWKKLIKENHPDRGGDEEMAKRINEAWTLLKGSYSPQMSSPGPGGPGGPGSGGTSPWAASYRGEGIPEWQTDERSTYNEINEQMGRRNKNYCLKEIYEFSQQQGDVTEVTFWAFDGAFSRGVFTAKSNEGSFGFGGEVMEHWNSKGANSYSTVAVFAQFKGDNKVKLVRLRGQDVSNANRWYEHNSFNANPFNDQKFTQEMRNL